MRSHNPYARSGSGGYNVPQLSTSAVLDAPKAARPVRVFALVDRYPPMVNAGGEWMLHNLLAHLAARGHQVEVATARVEEPYTLDGVDVWPVAQTNQLASQCDVMVGHLMWTRQAVETAARFERPLVYLAHNHRQLRHWSLVEQNMTVLVVNSRWLAGDIHTPRRRGIPESQAHGCSTWNGPSVVVRPTVRSADYRLDRDPAEADCYTLVNMTDAKGAGVFYRLADDMPVRRWLAVEGGYGDQRPPTSKHPGVEWQPQTPNIRDDVYRRTRVLLMPSNYESWGRVGVEAMASGIPVVASETKGIREALGDAAIYVDRADHAGWQHALAELDDPDMYRARSILALERSAVLDRLAQADLARWEMTVRAAAVAGGVPSATAPDPATAGATS